MYALEYTINMQPGVGVPPVVNVSQGDIDREIVFTVMDGLNPYEFTGNETCVITGTKPSGLGFTVQGTVSESTITFHADEEMTQEAGAIRTELVITDSVQEFRIGSANFNLVVEPTTHASSVIDGTTEDARTVLQECEQYANDAEASAQQAAQSATAAASAGAQAGEEAAESVVEDYYDSIMNNIVSNAYAPVDSVPFVEGMGYDYTGISVGSTMPATPPSAAGWNSCQYECQAGDVFIVTALGGSNMRTWGFTDKDRKLLSVSASNAPALNNSRLYAQSDGYLYINCASSFENPQVIHKRSFSDAYPDIMDAIEVTDDELTGLREDLNSIETALQVDNTSIIPDNLEWGIRTLSPTSGGPQPSTNTIASNFVEVSNDTLVTVTMEDGYTFSIYGYSTNVYTSFTGMIAQGVSGSYDISPNTANYIRFTIQKSDLSDFSDTSDSSKIAATIKEYGIVKQVEDNTVALSNVYTKSEVSAQLDNYYTKSEADGSFVKSGLETFGDYATFENGGLTSGNKTNVKYRVMTNTIMQFDYDLYVSIASGFKMAIHTFVDNTFFQDGNWTNVSLIIRKGTRFKMVIARETENTSETADIDTFVSKVTFPSKTSSELIKGEQNASWLQDLILNTNAIFYTPVETVHGYTQKHCYIIFDNIDPTATYGVKINRSVGATYDGIRLVAFGGVTALGNVQKRATSNIDFTIDLSQYEGVDRLGLDLFASYNSALSADGAKYYDVIVYKGSSLTMELTDKISVPDYYEAVETSKRAYPFYANVTPRYMRKCQHRGLSTAAPANSLPAFELAGQAHCWGVEMDVHRTSDGKYIICHNDTLDATTDGTGTIKNLTYSYIRSCHIDVGTNVDQYTAEELIVPDLEEALFVCKQYGMIAVLDIKNLSDNTANIQDIIDLVYKYGLQDSAVISSSTIGYITKSRSIDKRIHTAFSINALTDTILNTVRDFDNFTLAISATNATAETCETLHALDIMVNLWVPVSSAGEETQMRKGADWTTTEAPPS